MAKTTTIQIRVDEKLKAQANEVLSQLNITMSQAIKMFLSQIVHRDGIPIDLRLPNTEILKRIEEGEKGIGMREASSVEELMKELER